MTNFEALWLGKVVARVVLLNKPQDLAPVTAHAPSAIPGVKPIGRFYYERVSWLSVLPTRYIT
jgi:hypothetical protein